MNRAVVPRTWAPRRERAGLLRLAAVSAAMLSLAAAPSPAAARCTGDCNADGMVGVTELVSGVNLLLSNAAPLACPAVDANDNGRVEVAELISAVVNALGSCPTNTMLVRGLCQQPGGPGRPGLRPCDPGVRVDAYRCDDRMDCLRDPQRRLVGSGVVDERAGGFDIELDLESIQDTTLVFEALVEGGTAVRAIVIGAPGTPATGRAGGAPGFFVVISPFSEAAVRILDENGFETFTDEGVLAVVDAVEAAAATISYENVGAAEAADIATDLARSDPGVQHAIDTGRRVGAPTPTATPSPSRTGTPTRTPTPTFTPTLPPPRAIAYVSTGADQLALIDLETSGVLPSLTVGGSPLGVEAAPNGRLVGVANATADTVSLVDTRRRRVATTIPDPRAQPDEPFAVGFSADSGTAYVVNRLSGLVDVVDVSQALAGEPVVILLDSIAVGQRPLDIAVARGAAFALVTNNTGLSLSVIDTDSLEVRTLPLEHRPRNIALTPDDAYAYVTTEERLTFTREVMVVNTARARAGLPGAVERTFVLNANNPTGVAVAPDGRRVFVTSASDDLLTVIDRGPDDPLGEVAPDPIELITRSEPRGIALTSDGARAYVANGGAGSVSIVDALQGRFVTTVDGVGSGPRDIAVVDK